jgi:hypothetical protein
MDLLPCDQPVVQCPLMMDYAYIQYSEPPFSMNVMTPSYSPTTISNFTPSPVRPGHQDDLNRLLNSAPQREFTPRDYYNLEEDAQTVWNHERGFDDQAWSPVFTAQEPIYIDPVQLQFQSIPSKTRSRQVSSAYTCLDLTRTARSSSPTPTAQNSSGEPTFHRTATGRTPQDVEKDKFLISSRQDGLSYKEIKRRGGFKEAESTLRGRYRTLTKAPEQRRRKPTWSDGDACSPTMTATKEV